MFKRQCLSCGKGVGDWIPRGSSTADAPAWDDSLKDDTLERMFETRKQERESKNREWWRQYNEYLRGHVWASKRERVLKRDDNLCQACCRTRATEVHHLTYERVDFKGGEPLFDLVAVCHACHVRLHKKNPYWLTGDDIIDSIERRSA
jgi:5-methylcytosine-specific restriction endonuclease McrA